MGIDTIPIKDAIGGVGVLLNPPKMTRFSEAEGVDAAAGQKHRVALLDRDAMETGGNGLRGQLPLKFLAGNPALEADIKLRLGAGVGHIPHLGFGFASEGGGDFCRRMDLERQDGLGVNNFYEKREPAGGAMSRPEQSLGMFVKNLPQRAAFERPVGHHAFVAGAVADLPRFADPGRPAGSDLW